MQSTPVLGCSFLRQGPARKRVEIITFLYQEKAEKRFLFLRTITRVCLIAAFPESKRKAVSRELIKLKSARPYNFNFAGGVTQSRTDISMTFSASQPQEGRSEAEKACLLISLDSSARSSVL